MGSVDQEAEKTGGCVCQKEEEDWREVLGDGLVVEVTEGRLQYRLPA